MKQKLKFATIILGLLAAAAVAVALVVYLPSTMKVRVLGSEIKRLELTPAVGNRPATFEDVSYIQTEDAETGEVRVFRNVDAPLFGKFDVAEVSAQVTQIVTENPNATVLVSYYGVRIKMFGVYPNLVRLEEVAPDYRHVPVFNIVLLSLLFIGFGTLWLKIRGWKRRRLEKAAAKKAGAAPPADAQAGVDG